tara:strand:- start:223 stop:798 length:576 start_codon:yes stop_codon:yes gene_type:complete
MSSWGATTTDESKPKYLTTAEKRDVYATTAGWTAAAGGNPDGAREVLIAIGGLSGGTANTAGLAAATVSSVNWNIATFDKSAGGTLSITVNYNEAVDVVTTGGTPTIAVTGTGGRNHVLDYSGGTGTNRLTFIEPIAGGNAATNADDVLSVAAQNIAKNSGTIKDAGASTNAQIAISAGVGTAAGTITVVA